jgi:hypothetical protein
MAFEVSEKKVKFSFFWGDAFLSLTGAKTIQVRGNFSVFLVVVGI